MESTTLATVRHEPPPQATPAAARLPAAGVSPAGLLLSAAMLGCALQVNFGQYHPLALLWLTAALAGCVLSIGGSSWLRQLSERKALAIVTVVLGVQFALLLSRSPGATGAMAPGNDLTAFRAMVTAGALFAAGAIAARGVLSRACLWAMLLVHAGIGLWVLRAAPDPGVDVIMFQREACRALVDGQNPYAITFENPYQGRGATRFYGPDLVANGRLLFGFPYPPLSLLLVLPGYALGDVRHAHWAAMTVAGALVALAKPGRLATAAAAVLLFTPRGFFVLEAGWTEPLAVLLLAGAVFATCRAPRGSLPPVALGLLLAVKQYLVLAMLVAPLLPSDLTRRRSRFLAWTGIIAGAVTLPLALWNVSAFVHSAVVLQFRQPFRDDALSYLAAVAGATGWRPPAWVALFAVLPAVLFCLKKCPRSPAGVAAALGFIFLVFFASNKQAFCNYYHFVIGALCCAAGAAPAAADKSVIPA